MSKEVFSLAGVDGAAWERAAHFLERLRAFRHEHVLPVETWQRSAQTLVLTCPTPEHVSLRTWLEREQRLPFLECGRVLTELAQALSAANASGISHGSLDSAHVLWSDVHVLVDGFGRAQLRSLLENRSGEPSFEEDVRAFGTLAYQIVTGEIFFAGAPPPNALRAHVPPGLAALIVHCLDEDAARRPRPENLVRFTVGLVTPPANLRAPMLVRQAEYMLATEAPPWRQAQARLARALELDSNCPGADALEKELAAKRALLGLDS